jgi:hypothetical protein
VGESSKKEAVVVRAIRFLGVLPLLFISGNAPQPLEIADADAIANWPAPAFWTPPAVRAPRGARTDAVSPALPPLPFIALNPCRVADTRGNGFTSGFGPPPLVANATRTFTIAGQCGIPSTAAAVSFNFAALNVSQAGDLRVFPAGGGVPTVSTLNYNGNTPNIANAAVVPLGTAGAITVQADATSVDLIIDINGYYDGSGALQLSLSRRAALDQFWTTQNATALGLTTLGGTPVAVKSDGADIWVAIGDGASVSRVRASDGKLLETWTGATNPYGVLVAMGRILVTGGNANPSSLYMIDPSQPAGAVTTATSNLGANTFGLTFDGARVWTANGGGSVSIVTPGATIPWSVTTVTTGFSSLRSALFDGANVWVTDAPAGKLLKLDSAGVILQTVTVGNFPEFPAFDGTNIWVPNNGSASVTVVRASTGAVVQTLTGNGLNGPYSAAFDGQRVLVTNIAGGVGGVSLWKAADLTPLGSFPTNAIAGGACSDGINFWITLSGAGKLARF